MKAERFSAIPTISLPRLGSNGPVVLHTLLRDESGNFYYSDELNHVVASLDHEGKVRWFRGDKGSECGAFRYPRGLAL